MVSSVFLTDSDGQNQKWNHFEDDQSGRNAHVGEDAHTGPDTENDQGHARDAQGDLHVDQEVFAVPDATQSDGNVEKHDQVGDENGFDIGLRFALDFVFDRAFGTILHLEPIGTVGFHELKEMLLPGQRIFQLFSLTVIIDGDRDDQRLCFGVIRNA